MKKSNVPYILIIIEILIIGLFVVWYITKGKETKETDVKNTPIPTQSGLLAETTGPEPTNTPVPTATPEPTSIPTPVPTATPTSTPRPTEAPKKKEVSIVLVGNEPIVWVDTERYTFTNINKEMYVVESVDLREGPDMDCEIVGKLELGEEVYVEGKCNEVDWYLISRMGEMQFVETKYLSDISPIATPVPTPTTKPSSGLSAKAEARKESILSKMESNPKVSHCIDLIIGYTNDGYPLLTKDDPYVGTIIISENGKNALDPETGESIFGLKYLEGKDKDGNLIVAGEILRFATVEMGPSPDGGAQIGDPSKGNATIH